MTSHKSPMRFSIIMPAFNCARELQVSLPALMAAAITDDEIIVVDDASTDATAEIAASLGARLLRLARNTGPAGARNYGASHGRGEVLLFVDADVIVQPDVVERIREMLRHEPQVAAVFGSYDDVPQAPGIVSRYRNLLHHFVHHQGNHEASTFWAGLGAVRREAFVEASGFDASRFPRPSIEDIDFGYRLRRAGHRIRLDPTLQGTHLKAWTFWSMVRTDIVRRALPWARLNLEGGNSVGDLNLRADQRWSAVLLAFALVAAAAALIRPELWRVAFIGLVGVLVLNWRFYRLLWRRGGFSLAVGAVPLHLLYFFYSGITFVYAWTEWRLRRAATALQKRAWTVCTL